MTDTIWFRAGYICADCLNPPINDCVDNYVTQSSALAGAQDEAPGMIGIKKHHRPPEPTGWKKIKEKNEDEN